MNQMLHQILHQSLVQLRGQAEAWAAGRRVAGFKPPIGIRYNLNLLEVGRRELSDLIARWPGNSGDEDYPVPHPLRHPKLAYEWSSSAEFWNPQFEYARNRLALLDWLIDQTAPTN